MLIVLFFIAQIGLTWWVQNTVKETVVEAVRKNTLGASELNELAVLAQQIRRYEKEYFVYVGNVERRANYEKEWTDTSAKITKLLGKLRANEGGILENSEVAQVGVWWGAADFYASEMRKIFGMVNERTERVTLAERAEAAAAPVAPEKSKGAAAALVAVANVTSEPAGKLAFYTPGQTNELIKEGKDRFSSELVKGVAKLQAEKTAATLALAEASREGFQTLILGVTATALIGIVIALLLVYFIPRSVLQPVTELTATVDAISLGDTTGAGKSTGVKEFEGLEKAVDRMRQAQQALVSRLRARSA